MKKKVAKHFKNHFGLSHVKTKDLSIDSKADIDWGEQLLKDLKETIIIYPKTSLENFGRMKTKQN